MAASSPGILSEISTQYGIGLGLIALAIGFYWDYEMLLHYCFAIAFVPAELFLGSYLIWFGIKTFRHH